MDLHLLRASPPGTPRTDGDCYYVNCQPYEGLDWGVSGVDEDNPALDLDDLTGLGPETISILEPAGAPYEGSYRVLVHDYPGSVHEGPNEVTVRVYVRGLLEPPFYFSLSGEDADYYVAKIEWPSGVVLPCDGLAGCP